MGTNNKQIITEGLAELVGFFAADGSMQRDYICFWGNPNADAEYYDIHLRSLFRREFNIEIRPHEKPSNSVYGFYVCNKKVLHFFRDTLGLPIGKKTYTIDVPEIIQKSDDSIICAFIRGFFAGDGCLNFDKRYKNRKKILNMIHTYPRIQIKCACKLLMYQLSDMLNKLGIKNFVSRKPSKKTNEVDQFMLQVSGRSRLEKWTKKIGFSNPSHRSRYDIYKKYGFVPPNTSYTQRKQILLEELHPAIFYKKAGLKTAEIGDFLASSPFTSLRA